MQAVALIVGSWWALAAAFIGVGWWATEVLRQPDDVRARLATLFFLGLAAVVVLLQLWHLAFAINEWSFAAFWMLGLTGLFRARRSLRPSVQAAHPVVWGLLAVASVGLAYRSLEQPQNGDSLLYHLQAVRWAASYPVVRGIGNLNPFLAYGHSYSLYVALLDHGWFAHRSHHVANGLLVLVLIGRGVTGAIASWRQRANRGDAVALVLLLPAVNLALGRDLTSPTSNFGEFVIGCVLAIELAQAFDAHDNPGDRGARWWVVMALASLATVFKFSSALLGFGTFMLAAGFAWNRGGRGPMLMVGAAIGAVTVFPFAAGVALRSGYFPYPYPLVAFPTVWQVPADVHRAVTEYIGDYCRGTLFADRSGWFGPWLTTMALDNRQVIAPLAVGVAGSVAALFKWRAIPRTAFWLLGPVVAALAAWFLVAPAVDYVGSLMWALAALCVGTVGTVPRWMGLAAYSIAAGILLDARPLVGGREGLQDAPIGVTGTFVTQSGLVLYVSARACGDAPVPCADFPDPGLRLIEAGRLEGGFTLRPADGSSAVRPPAILKYVTYPRLKPRVVGSTPPRHFD